MTTVSAEDAKQLGERVLTIRCAETAGNKDGRIPSYSGTPTTKLADPNKP